MPKKKKKMSYERRRRQDRSRKRLFRGSQSDLSPMNGNHGNYVSKAYAINEFNFEDLDRMIMFITESKQIQGRYYVRYLPGMLNSAGELTPCNYRPVFSFTSTATASDYNFVQNNDYSDGSPEVVDLTDSDGVSSENSNPASPASPSTADETQEKHTEVEGSENGESGEKKDSKSETPGAEKANVSKSVPGFLSTINRKQTARKSMRQQTESLSCGTENSASPAMDMETESSSVSASNSDSVNTNNNIRSKSTSSSINKNNLVANSSITSNCKSKLPSDKWDILDGITVTMNPDFR